MKVLRKATLLAFAFSALSVAAYGQYGGGAAQTDRPESGAAGAATGQERAGWPSFSELDKTNSGFISQDDVANVPGIDFNAADLDGDGRLSRQEYEAARGGAVPPGGNGGTPSAPAPTR